MRPLRLKSAFAVLPVLLFSRAAFAQYSDLAVTDDGSRVYFQTSLRLASEASQNLPLTSAIYEVAGGAIRRLTVPEPFLPGPPYQFIGNPNMSADGTIFSYTHYSNCSGGSACISRPSTSTSYLTIGGQTYSTPLMGEAQISRNGRYVFSALQFGFTLPAQADVLTLYDLQTGTTVPVTVRPAGRRQALTSDGRVLGRNLPSGPLSIWSPQGTRILANTEPANSAIVNDSATWVIYESAGESQVDLRAIEVATGRDVLLASHPPDAPAFQPSVSNDATVVLYLAVPALGQPAQAWTISPDGSARRQLTSFADGVSEAVIAGNGQSVVATTGNRLVAIDRQSQAVRELIGITPLCNAGFTSLTPGSILPIRGAALASTTEVAPTPLPTQLAGTKVLLDGQPLPLLSVSPSELWFQVPFELTPGPTATVALEHSSVFEGCPAVRVPITARQPYFFNYTALILAHQDFTGLVTLQSPAQPGEIVTAYAVGLGAVTPAMTTGIPTPSDRLFPLAAPFECHAGYTDGPPVEVLFAGLAPGMIGIYQVNFRIPEPVPAAGFFFLNCGTPGNAFEHGGGIVLVPSQ